MAGIVVVEAGGDFSFFVVDDERWSQIASLERAEGAAALQQYVDQVLYLSTDEDCDGGPDFRRHGRVLRSIHAQRYVLESFADIGGICGLVVVQI